MLMSTACLHKITQQKLRNETRLKLIYLNHAKHTLLHSSLSRCPDLEENKG